jgi:hypothetical protein
VFENLPKKAQQAYPPILLQVLHYGNNFLLHTAAGKIYDYEKRNVWKHGLHQEQCIEPERTAMKKQAYIFPLALR